MSPIQWDGIHAYILLPREFKRQRRSSRLKAIQSFFFLPPPQTHSEPSNSKTQMCTIIYEAVALQILLRCCAPCPLTFFRSEESRLEHCFFEDIVCLTWRGHWWCELLFWMSFWLVWAAGLTGTLADGLVSGLSASYRVSRNPKGFFVRTNCSL